MISVCVIVKNEERNIERCLAALAGCSFELVVADTGSTDGTREVVRKYTDSLYKFEWCDDFSAAKNYVVSKAKHDLVMVVDSDEFLEPLSGEELKELTEQIRRNPEGVGRIRRRNVFTRDGLQQENQEWVNRIFDRRKFHYEGRIHEQIVSNDGRDYQTWLSPLSFVHSGYDLSSEERKRKTQRNIKLLEGELAQVYANLTGLKQAGTKSQETADLEKQVPYLLYQLGKSYYMEKDYVLSCKYFEDALSHDLNPKLEYVIDMVETYGYALINSGQEQTALFFENIYEEFGNSADFQFLMGLIYMKNAMFHAAIKEFEKAQEHKECRNMGVNSYAANYNMGVILECLGDIEKAVTCYGKCGEYAPAQGRLKEILYRKAGETP